MSNAVLIFVFLRIQNVVIDKKCICIVILTQTDTDFVMELLFNKNFSWKIKKIHSVQK